MNFNFYIVLIFCLSIFANKSYSENIAFIDMELILSNSKVGISTNKQIEEKTLINQKKLKKMEDNLRKSDNEINSQKNILKDEELKKKISELNSDIQEYQKALQNNRNDINAFKISATGKLLQTLKPILESYSKEKNISIIFQKKDLIIAKNSLNITNDIIKILDQKITKINLNE